MQNKLIPCGCVARLQGHVVVRHVDVKTAMTSIICLLDFALPISFIFPRLA